jgi:hypothetical protein
VSDTVTDHVTVSDTFLKHHRGSGARTSYTTPWQRGLALTGMCRGRVSDTRPLKHSRTCKADDPGSDPEGARLTALRGPRRVRHDVEMIAPSASLIAWSAVSIAVWSLLGLLVFRVLRHTCKPVR